MDHGDHGGHGGMPDMDMPKCSMNMLWNNQVADTCVVFRSWHISSSFGMFISCVMIVAISVGFAALIAHTRRYERSVAQALLQAPRPAASGYSSVDDQGQGVKVGLLPRGFPLSAEWDHSLAGYTKDITDRSTRLPVQARVVRASLYAVSIAVSYFLMLVAMTYNSYLCAAIIIGAFLGHYIYEDEVDLSGTSGRGMACH